MAIIELVMRGETASGDREDAGQQVHSAYR